MTVCPPSSDEACAFRTCSELACPGNISSTCVNGTCICLPDEGSFGGGDNCTNINVTIIPNVGQETQCSQANCSNNGVCLMKNEGSFFCICFGDFTGQFCEVNLNTRNCTDGLCSEYEMCLPDLNGDPQCVCAPGRTGEKCEFLLPCVNLNCSENSMCARKNDSDEYFCECFPGYSGETCESLSSTSTMLEQMDTTAISHVLAGSMSVSVLMVLLGVIGGILAMIIVCVIVGVSLIFLRAKNRIKKKCKHACCDY